MNAGPHHPSAAHPHERGAARTLRQVGHPQGGHASPRSGAPDALDAERIAVREALAYKPYHFPLRDHYTTDRWMYGDAHDRLTESGDWREPSTSPATATCARTCSTASRSSSRWRTGRACRPPSQAACLPPPRRSPARISPRPRTLESLGLAELSREAMQRLLDEGLGERARLDYRRGGMRKVPSCQEGWLAQRDGVVLRLEPHQPFKPHHPRPSGGPLLLRGGEQVNPAPRSRGAARTSAPWPMAFLGRDCDEHDPPRVLEAGERLPSKSRITPPRRARLRACAPPRRPRPRPTSHPPDPPPRPPRPRRSRRAAFSSSADRCSPRRDDHVLGAADHV